MSGERPFTFGVVGLGVIGGSLVQRLLRSARGRPVIGFDTDAATRSAARKAGIVVPRTLSGIVNQAEFVVVATPPEVTASVCIELLKRDTDVVVSDATSAKHRIIREVQDAIRAPAFERFIPSHPLAGNEGSGWSAADHALFDNSVWVATPSREGSLSRARRLFQLLDLLHARLLVMEPSLHDEVVAYTSHLPQVLSTLVAAYQPQRFENLAAVVSGGGLRDMTRVAESQSGLWAEILELNEVNVLRALGDFRGLLNDFEQDMRSRNEQRIRDTFSVGREKRRVTVDRRWSEPRWHSVKSDQTDFELLFRIGIEGFLTRRVRLKVDSTSLEVGVATDREDDFATLASALDLVLSSAH